MDKKHQRILTAWTNKLRDLEVYESFFCTLEEKQSIAPIASRLKKTEKLFFTIKKFNNGLYKVERVEDTENEIKLESVGNEKK